jgi:hypothetical protein
MSKSLLYPQKFLSVFLYSSVDNRDKDRTEKVSGESYGK